MGWRARDAWVGLSQIDPSSQPILADWAVLSQFIDDTMDWTQELRIAYGIIYLYWVNIFIITSMLG